MTNANPDSGTDTAFLREKLTTLHRDAIFLFSHAQGVDALYDTIKTEISPAANSMPALMESLIERASKLAEGLEALEVEAQRAGL